MTPLTAQGRLRSGPGYQALYDNSTTRTGAEFSVGAIPDNLLTPAACNVAGSTLILDNIEAFNSDPQGIIVPGLGLIQAHTNSTINLSGNNNGAIPQQDNDFYPTIFDSNSMGNGPGNIQAATYSNGQQACLTVIDPEGNRTVTPNFNTQLTAPVNPLTGVTEPTLISNPGYSIGTQIPPPVSSTPTVSASGGSITTGNVSVAEAIVESTAFPPGTQNPNGFTGTYPNATILTPGTLYNGGPTVSTGGLLADTRTITSIATVAATGTATVCLSVVHPADWTVGAYISMYGLTATTVDKALNGWTWKIVTNTGTGCSISGVTLQSPGIVPAFIDQATTSETAHATIPYCPYWITKAQTDPITGAVTGIGGTSAGTPGYCTIPPGGVGKLPV